MGALFWRPRDRVARFWPILELWWLVALVAFIASALAHLGSGQNLGWVRIVSDLLGWLLWAMLLPVAVWATERLRWTEQPRILILVQHATVGVVVAGVYSALNATKSILLMGWQSGLWAMSFSTLFKAYFLGGLPLYALVYAVLWMAIRVQSADRRLQLEERRSLELRAALSEARLQSLRAQLDPHFLFNALNGVAAHLRLDPAGAESSVVKLAEFLRLTLRDGRRQEVPLREELTFLEAYVAVEQARFGEDLKVEIAVEEDVMTCLVPSLVLQPLVENAVRHGMRAEGMSVHIAAQGVDGELVLTVADDGCGNGSRGVGTGDGIGLANTRARLRELYGARSGVVLAEPAGGGFLVTVTIPRRDSQGDAASPIPSY